MVNNALGTIARAANYALLREGLSLTQSGGAGGSWKGKAPPRCPVGATASHHGG